MKLGGKCKLVRISDKFLIPKVAKYFFFGFKQTDLKNLEHIKKNFQNNQIFRLSKVFKIFQKITIYFFQQK